MKGFLNIAFVGSGNLAWHLAPALENIGHRVSLVYNRNPKNRKNLIERLYNANPQKTLDFSNAKINLVFICVTDSAIESVVSEIILPDNCMLVHCSGSISLETLSLAAPESYGVFYPMYSFSKTSKINFRDVPVYIEGSDKQIEKLLLEIAKNLSRNVFKLDSSQRLSLHLAAVFASNFTNHLLSIAQELLQDEKLSLEYIQTLVQGSINKAFEIGPMKGQSGPAVREDQTTLKKHMELLSEKPELRKIYSILSNHIIEMHKGKQ